MAESLPPREPDLAQKLLRYLELRIEYELLQSRQRATGVVAQGLIWLGVGVLLLSTVLFAGVALALLIGLWTTPAIGFAIVALLFVGLAWWLYGQRTRYQRHLNARLTALFEAKLDTPAPPTAQSVRPLNTHS